MSIIWTAEDIATLRGMHLDGATPEEIAAKLKRTVEAVNHKVRALDAPGKPKPFSLPPLDQCTWLEGEKPNYIRCTVKVWNGSSWCYEHWKKTHVYGPRSKEEAL